MGPTPCYQKLKKVLYKKIRYLEKAFLTTTHKRKISKDGLEASLSFLVLKQLMA